MERVRADNARLTAELAATLTRVAQVETDVAELQQRTTAPPAFVKKNSPPRAPKERKKRAPEHNAGRRRAEPIRIVCGICTANCSSSCAPLGSAPTTNHAERSLRHLVITRKISGGSQSAGGTQTRLALASFFGTWQTRGLNPFTECLALLRYPLSFQQI